MPKTKQQKEENVKLLHGRLLKANATVFTNFDGLTVDETNDLRTQLRDAGVEYTVAKKSLLKAALKDSAIEGVDVDSLSGGLGMATGYNDEIVPAKILNTFAEKHPALKLIGGIFNNRFIDAGEVAALAALPSRQELAAKIVWLIQYPLSGFVNVLAGNMRKFIYSLQAIKDKKS